VNILLCSHPGCVSYASVSVRTDPFGKNDKYANFCPAHAPRGYVGTAQSFYCPNCQCERCGNTFAANSMPQKGPTSSLKCTCGAEANGGTLHSNWCGEPTPQEGTQAGKEV
jgi:hypothetical protein